MKDVNCFKTTSFWQTSSFCSFIFRMKYFLYFSGICKYVIAYFRHPIHFSKSDEFTFMGHLDLEVGLWSAPPFFFAKIC